MIRINQSRSRREIETSKVQQVPVFLFFRIINSPNRKLILVMTISSSIRFSKNKYQEISKARYKDR